MKPLTVELTAKVAWWWEPYVKTVKLFCMTFGTEPDVEKQMRFLLKYGFRVRFGKGRWRRVNLLT